MVLLWRTIPRALTEEVLKHLFQMNVRLLLLFPGTNCLGCLRNRKVELAHFMFIAL